MRGRHGRFDIIGRQRAAADRLVRRRLPAVPAGDRLEAQTADGCPVGPADLLARFHAQEQGGPLVSGAAAFAALWRRSRALRPLGLAARWPPLLWLMERAYRGFLRIRPQLQRLAAGNAPDG